MSINQCTKNIIEHITLKVFIINGFDIFHLFFVLILHSLSKSNITIIAWKITLLIPYFHCGISIKYTTSIQKNGKCSMHKELDLAFGKL